jgi:hypothetical protein
MIAWIKLHFKAILYFFFGLLLFIAVGLWVYISYYYEDLLNRFAIPKLQEAALTATNGNYRLKLGSVSYHHHTVWLRGFDLYRVRYTAGEKGIAVKRVLIDSVEFTGVNIWKIILGKGLTMTSLQMQSPKIFITDLSKEKPTPVDVNRDSVKLVSSMPRKLPVISFDSISLRDMQLYLIDRQYPRDPPSFKGINFKLTDFYFNSETKAAQPVLFSKRADISIPSVKYPVGNGNYSLEFKNLRGNSKDSIITVDHFGIVSNYSEDAFAARQKYASPMLNFTFDGIRIEGINFVSSFSKANIVLRKFSASSWMIDSYEDRRRPANPNPPPAVMPNEVISSVPIKIDIGTIALSGGKIKIRERTAAGAGQLGFDRAAISISPLTKDTLSPRYHKPSVISMSAYFVGQALLRATAIYPLYEKTLNLDLHATLGSFDATKLNTWLVPFERLQVQSGIVRSGKIDMNIRAGTATTRVTPVYDNFEAKILSKIPGQPTSLMEKIETIVAEAFILHDGNPNKSGELKTAITSVARTRNQEFLQFIWIALRKSLGQVVGGFQ